MRETALKLVVMEHLICAWPESTQIVCPCACNLDYNFDYGKFDLGDDDFFADVEDSDAEDIS